MHVVVRVSLVCTALAALAAPSLVAKSLIAACLAAPDQITASSGDSRIERFAPGRTGRAAIVSTGDLTPAAPGNDDGSSEVFFVDFDSGRLVQVTQSARSSGAYRVTEDGDVVVGSQADLTPLSSLGGNADGSFETWFWTRRTEQLEQITGTPFDTFFQTYDRQEHRAFFVSKGDLRPGDPGNPDGRNDVFTLNIATGQLRQLTSGDQESLTRAIDPTGRAILIQSRGDLAPRPTRDNTDGSFEIFLADLPGLALRQLTASDGDTTYAGWSPNGRYIAVTSEADLVPGGNADGSREVYVIDTRRNRVLQITDSDGDSDFAAFGPRSHRVGVHSRGDLLPGSNTDGSQEVFVGNLRNGVLRQLTNSSGDSHLGAFAARRRWAAVMSDGDLTPGAPGNADGSAELYLVRIAGRRSATIQATDGTEPVLFRGFDPRGRTVAVDSRSDLVPGDNADGSREVYVRRVRRKAPLRQLTASGADSEVGGFLPDGRRIVLHSRGDLDPAGAGNADGSLEVFVERVR